MPYDETRTENAAAYCPLCDAPTDSSGLALSAGGEDLSDSPGHCEGCGAERDAAPGGSSAGAAILAHACCVEAVGFIARWAGEDPVACAVALIGIAHPSTSCRDIAARIGLPKTTVNAAQVRASQYCGQITSILGRNTAAAIAQRARRALERMAPAGAGGQLELIQLNPDERK